MRSCFGYPGCRSPSSAMRTGRTLLPNRGGTADEPTRFGVQTPLPAPVVAGDYVRHRQKRGHLEKANAGVGILVVMRPVGLEHDELAGRCNRFLVAESEPERSAVHKQLLANPTRVCRR